MRTDVASALGARSERQSVDPRRRRTMRKCRFSQVQIIARATSSARAGMATAEVCGRHETRLAAF